MLERLRNAILPSKAGNLSKVFWRLGWAGIWLQILFGSLPILLMLYYFAFSSSSSVPRKGLAFVEYLTVLNLLVLLFTICWSYRYTRLGLRLADPSRVPSQSQLVGIVWTGVLASATGMLFSMIVLLIEAASLLLYFLKAPQGGIPVIQTSGSDAAYFITTVDMVSLMALQLTLFAELLVLVFSLWLLFRSTLGSPELAGSDAG